MASTSHDKGMTVIETVISIAIFAVISTAGYSTYIATNRLVEHSDNKSRAIALSEEGIEAARSMRDQNFSNLVAGTYGIALGTSTGNVWAFSGSSDTTNGYLRKVSIAAVDSNTYIATSTVSWKEYGATSTVSLTEYLTNWRKSVGMSDGIAINSSGANLTLHNSLLTGISISTDGSYGTTTIVSVQQSWSGVSGMRNLLSIQSPYSTTVFTGNVASGGTATFTTPIALIEATSKTIQFQYNATMLGATFTYMLTFSDGSTKTFTIINPPAM